MMQSDPADDLRRAKSYVPIIERVLRENAALTPMSIYLALGAACPAHTPNDKAIWLGVIREYDAFIEADPDYRVARLVCVGRPQC